MWLFPKSLNKKQISDTFIYKSQTGRKLEEQTESGLQLWPVIIQANKQASGGQEAGLGTAGDH